MASLEQMSREYLENATDRPEEAAALLAQIRRVRPLEPPAKVFEIGVGSGWLLASFANEGFECAGIEINPWLREHAIAMLAAQGHTVEILAGTIETAELADNTYDIVLAESVLEHVPDWHAALARIYATLRPGGVFRMNSTNKLSPVSGENPGVPLYGWLPRVARLQFRKHNIAVNPAGFDWNQFTYAGLRRELRRVGFSEVYDRFDLYDPGDKTGWRCSLIASYQRWPLLKLPLLAFDFGTAFVCVK